MSSELVAFDPRPGDVISRQTAPDCLRGLQADPVGGGFLGIYAADAHWRVGQFDADGLLVASSSVASLQASARMVVSTPEAWVVLVNQPVLNGGRLVFLDREDLRFQREIPFPESLARDSTYLTAIPFRGDVLAVFNRRGEFVEVMDRTTGEIRRSFRLNDMERMVENDVGFAMVFAGERIVWSGYRKPEAIYLTDDRQILGTVTFYEGDAQMHAAIVDPADATRVVVGVTFSDGSARVAHLDPLAPRFLPGSVPVGSGVVSDLLVGPTGGLWAVLPDNGTLVRLTPATGGD